MPTSAEVIERWHEIEHALQWNDRLPDEARRYLLDAAQHLIVLVEDQRITPEQAAKRVPEAIEMTGHTIRAWRDQRRADNYGWLFEKTKGLVRGRGSVKRVALDIADAANVSVRVVYRWAERRNKN
jgi:hypothetical protein